MNLLNLTDDQVIKLLSFFIDIKDLMVTDHGAVTEEKAVDIIRLDNSDNPKKAGIQVRSWEGKVLMNIFKNYFRLASNIRNNVIRRTKINCTSYKRAFDYLESEGFQIIVDED